MVRPITEGGVTRTLEGRLVAIVQEGDQVRVTTHSVHEMDVVRGVLRQAGILYEDGPLWNTVYCIGIKEE